MMADYNPFLYCGLIHLLTMTIIAASEAPSLSNHMVTGQSEQEGPTYDSRNFSTFKTARGMLGPQSTGAGPGVKINCYYCNLIHYGGSGHPHHQLQDDDGKCLKESEAKCPTAKCPSGNACDVCEKPRKCKKNTCSSRSYCDSQGLKGYGCLVGKCVDNNCTSRTVCDKMDFKGYGCQNKTCVANSCVSLADCDTLDFIGYGCKNRKCEVNTCSYTTDCNNLGFQGYGCLIRQCVKNSCMNRTACDKMGFMGYGCNNKTCVVNKCSYPADCESLDFQGYGCKSSMCAENRCNSPADCMYLGFKNHECPGGKCVVNKCRRPAECDALGYKGHGCSSGICVVNTCNSPSDCDSLGFNGYVCNDLTKKCERNGCNRPDGLCSANGHCCWDHSSCERDERITNEGRCVGCLQVGERVTVDGFCRSNADCCGKRNCNLQFLDPPYPYGRCTLPDGDCLRDSEGCTYSRDSCCSGLSCKYQTGTSPAYYQCEQGDSFNPYHGVYGG